MNMHRSKIARFFSRYPADSLIRPGLLETLIPGKRASRDIPEEGVICFQGVSVKLYFLVFGLIRQQLRLHANLRAELVVVRSINGAIGTGWLAFLKRWSVLSWWWSSQWERAYGPVMDGVAYRSAALFQPVDDLRDWFKSKSLWMAFKSQKEDFSLVVNGVEVGDLVVDSYLRFRPSPRFDAHDPFVRNIIWQALRDIRQAYDYFSRVKPKFYLSSYSIYIEHGVAARVAMLHGVPVWAFGDLVRFSKRLSPQDVYHTTSCVHYRAEFEQLDRHEERLAEAETQLQLRMSGGIDPATSYMRQSAYSGPKSMLPPDLNGAVVVFLHDFYDSPHIYSDLIFCDFWRWICFTIEVLQASGVTFYLKPHPNQIALSQAALTDLRARYPDVNWLLPTANNAQLAQAGMICGITMYGTVANELAYLGVSSICCALHPHHNFDFCRTAKTREEYKAMLESPGVLPVDKKEMQRQALMFYYMHNLHGSSDEIALRQAFIQLWRSCNIGEVEDDIVISAIHSLRDQSGFKSFIQNLVIP